MEFRDSYRMEAIYFQTLKEEINRVKALMASGNTEQAKTLLENAVNVDGAVLLLYRNLGELWSELGAKIEETKKELEKLDSRVDDYHTELNEKIDDVNNTIIRLINALEERVEALEECCEDVQEDLEKKQDKMIVHFTPTDNGNEYDSDKTFKEIYDAINAGSDVLGYVYTVPTEDSYDAPLYYVTRIKSHYLAIDDHLEDAEPYYEEHGKIVFSSESLNETYLPVYFKECTVFIEYEKSIESSETYEESRCTGIVTTDSRSYTIALFEQISNINFTEEELEHILQAFRYYPVNIIVTWIITPPTGQVETRVYHSAYTYRAGTPTLYEHYCFTSDDFTSRSLVTHIIDISKNLETSEITVSTFDI